MILKLGCPPLHPWYPWYYRAMTTMTVWPTQSTPRQNLEPDRIRFHKFYPLDLTQKCVEPWRILVVLRESDPMISHPPWFRLSHLHVFWIQLKSRWILLKTPQHQDATGFHPKITSLTWQWQLRWGSVQTTIASSWFSVVYWLVKSLKIIWLKWPKDRTIP